MIRHQQGATALGYTQATVRAQVALIGYQVFSLSWRQGIGSAAVSKTLGIIFGLKDVSKAIVLVDTRNEASIALLSRLSFRRTQLIERADFFKGQQSDEWEYELTRRDWYGTDM